MSKLPEWFKDTITELNGDCREEMYPFYLEVLSELREGNRVGFQVNGREVVLWLEKGVIKYEEEN